MNGILPEIRPFIKGIENTPYAQEQSKKRQSGKAGAPEKSASTNFDDKLTDEEKQEVARLKKIDAAVRRHEMAHIAASAGNAASGASFEYKTGPDGQRYAVAGDVQIDLSGVPDDPEATIRKAQQVRNAALAPSDPSAQDRRVAAMASQMEMEARMELAKKRAEEPEKGYDKTGKKINIFDKVPTFQVRA